MNLGVESYVDVAINNYVKHGTNYLEEIVTENQAAAVRFIAL